MINYKLELPDDFDDYAWEIESKGWFSGSIAMFDGKHYKVTFYDPTRLAQDIDNEIDESGIFFESNLVVVKNVDRISMEKAVEFIAETGKYVDMVEEKNI